MDITLSPKVEALYNAIDSLMNEGFDVNSLTVAQITGRAGIGKGTTYDYFKNKEELIGGAIVYKIRMICREIQTEMAKKPSLREMIYYLFDTIDNKEHEKAVFLRIVNIVTDTSPLNREIEKIIHERIGDIYMPERILDDILERAGKEGYKAENKPATYMKLNIGAKLITYLMFNIMPDSERDCDTETMRRLVFEGMMKEL